MATVSNGNDLLYYNTNTNYSNLANWGVWSNPSMGSGTIDLTQLTQQQYAQQAQWLQQAYEPVVSFIQSLRNEIDDWLKIGE
jgi:hypothetical protein